MPIWQSVLASWARTDTLWHATTRSVAATILVAVFIRAVRRFIPRATSLAPGTGFGAPSASTRLASETIRHYVAELLCIRTEVDCQEPNISKRAGADMMAPPAYRVLFLLVVIGLLLIAVLPEAAFVLPAVDAVGLDIVTIFAALELRHYLASVARVVGGGESYF